MYKLWCFCGFTKVKEKPFPLLCPRCRKRLQVTPLDVKTMEPVLSSKNFYFLEWLFKNNPEKEVAVFTNGYHLGDKIVYYSWMQYLAIRYPVLQLYTNDFINTDICPELSIKLLVDKHKNMHLLEDDDIHKLPTLPYTKILLTTPPLMHLANFGYTSQTHNFSNSGGCIVFTGADKEISLFSNFDILHYMYHYNKEFKLYIPGVLNPIENTFNIDTTKYNFLIHLRRQGWANYKDISVQSLDLISHILNKVYETNYVLYIISDIPELELSNFLDSSNHKIVNVKDYNFYEILSICKYSDGAFVPESVLSLMAEYCNLPFIGIGFQYKPLSNILKCMAVRTNKNIIAKDIYNFAVGVNYGNYKVKE